jgi:hypothetical protein
LAARARWLVACQHAEAAPGGDIVPKPDMMRRLRQSETQRLAEDLSRRRPTCPLNPDARLPACTSAPSPRRRASLLSSGSRTPWRPGLEPFKGRAVTGMIGPTRVTWSLDRGRTLPGRG